jgi:hypothetical protein
MLPHFIKPSDDLAPMDGVHLTLPAHHFISPGPNERVIKAHRLLGDGITRDSAGIVTGTPKLRDLGFLGQARKLRSFPGALAPLVPERQALE